jgi:hypothetical protein
MLANFGCEPCERLTIGSLVYALYNESRRSVSKDRRITGVVADPVTKKPRPKRVRGSGGRGKKKSGAEWHPMDEDADLLIRACMVGGRTQCLTSKRGEPVKYEGPLRAVDVHSMYPYVQTSDETFFPCGPPTYDGPWDPTKHRVPVDPKEDGIVFFGAVQIESQAKWVVRPKKGETLDWRFRGRFEEPIAMNSIDLAHLIKLGGVARVCAGVRVLMWDADSVRPGSSVFAVMKEWYREKDRQDALKKAGSPLYNKAWRESVKLLLNNLWGKMGQSNYNEGQTAVIRDGADYAAFMKKHSNVGLEPCTESFCVATGDGPWDAARAMPSQLACLVLSYARRHLLTLIVGIGGALYCDTDSVLAPLEAVNAYQRDHPEMFGPALGQLDDEWEPPPETAEHTAYFIRPKLYCLRAASAEGETLLFKGRAKGLRILKGAVPERDAEGRWHVYTDRFCPGGPAYLDSLGDDMGKKREAFMRMEPFAEANAYKLYERLHGGERVSFVRSNLRKTTLVTTRNRPNPLSLYQMYYCVTLSAAVVSSDDDDAGGGDGSASSRAS